MSLKKSLLFIVVNLTLWFGSTVATTNSPKRDSYFYYEFHRIDCFILDMLLASL